MPDLLQILEPKLNETIFSIISHSFSIKYILPLFIFIFLSYKWLSSNTNSSAPPSPPKLPIIGNLHQLGLSLLPHRSLHTLSERHGPVILLHLGSRPVLVISSAQGASQIFKTHDIIFSNRPKLIFFEKFLYNYRDLASAPYGEYWRQLRSICVSNLLSNTRVRSFGIVRQEETNLMISNIRQSCRPLIATSSSSSSSFSPVLNLSEIFIKLSNDVFCRVALGRKYSDGTGESDAKMLRELFGDLTKIFTRANIGDYIPWLSWYTRVSGFDAELDTLAKRLDDFFEMLIQEHIDGSKDGMNENKKHTDFVDILLEVQKENTGGFSIDRTGIKALILDTFVAGTHTISTALEWAMSELLKNPRVMKNLQTEVRRIVGNKTNISEDDLIEMHYLKAVIKETFRLHPPDPLLVPRMSNQDVKINGYNIKANTQVLISAWSIGRDPNSYEDPLCYKPERFLNSIIDYKGTDFELVPFGGGRRGCPGIQFATSIEEIVLSNIVHNFDWLLPDGASEEDLDMNETTGVTALKLIPLKAIATPYFAISN